MWAAVEELALELGRTRTVIVIEASGIVWAGLLMVAPLSEAMK